VAPASLPTHCDGFLQRPLRDASRQFLADPLDQLVLVEARQPGWCFFFDVVERQDNGPYQAGNVHRFGQGGRSRLRSLRHHRRLSRRPQLENIISISNDLHILEERFGGRVSLGRAGTFPIPSPELIARKDRLIGLALRLNLWGLLARAQSEMGPCLMLSQLSAEPQLTISPRIRDGDLGGFGRRALRENVMIDDAEQDPLGAGSGNKSSAARAMYQLGTIKATTFPPIGRVVSSRARRDTASE
jgi:hypothetical protein